MYYRLCMLKKPSHGQQMAAKVCLIISFLVHVAPIQCEVQRSMNLNNHVANNNNNNTTSLYPHSSRAFQYQNLSLSANRPIERPSLNLVPNRNVGSPISDLSSLDAPPEGYAADWFMMGGAGGSLAGSELTGDLMTDESRGSAAHLDPNKRISKRSDAKRRGAGSKGNRTVFDDESTDSSDSNEILDDAEESSSTLAGTQKEPECAGQGRYYCAYKEEYPLKLVTEVTKYYKWPLEKLFRDLHAQIMPKLAQDSTGNLVCDSITRVVRPGWARNTNERWLVVINTENYHQYVTEVVCQYGTNSRCNFIPPCYYSSCQQRYNTQKLLVIDPSNPYRGPFLSEFLFPSCCVCYVPSSSDSFQDRYRSSPATIYQRTMQQESASNLHPPQFRPPGILEDSAAAGTTNNNNHLTEQSIIQSSRIQSPDGNNNIPNLTQNPAKVNQAPGVGEIRRGGDQHQYRRHEPSTGRQTGSRAAQFVDFPRLGLADSLISSGPGDGPKSDGENAPNTRQ